MQNKRVQCFSPSACSGEPVRGESSAPSEDEGDWEEEHVLFLVLSVQLQLQPLALPRYRYANWHPSACVYLCAQVKVPYLLKANACPQRRVRYHVSNCQAAAGLSAKCTKPIWFSVLTNEPWTLSGNIWWWVYNLYLPRLYNKPHEGLCTQSQMNSVSCTVVSSQVKQTLLWTGVRAAPLAPPPADRPVTAGRAAPPPPQRSQRLPPLAAARCPRGPGSCLRRSMSKPLCPHRLRGPRPRPSTWLLPRGVWRGPPPSPPLPRPGCTVG